MKNELLLVLAAAWEDDAITPEIQNGSDAAKEFNAYKRGYRECKRECADILRTMVKIIKEDALHTLINKDVTK